jgi:signal transduction histidine kinase
MDGAADVGGLLHAILTCVTAGPGLGFNRAALFLADPDERHLVASLAIGPATPEEARATWARLAREEPALHELLARPTDARAASGFAALVDGLAIPLDDGREAPDPLVEAYRGRRVMRIADAASLQALPPRVRAAFAGTEVVCVPLVANTRALGVVVADNAFTGEPIGDERLQHLQLFALLAAVALDNARAYAQIERQAEQLRQALDDLERAQGQLVHRERLAAVGAVVARVSHEIRNPLSTIGGFARRLGAAPADAARVRRNAGIIAAEVEDLEQLLKEMLDFTSPRAPALAPANVNHLVLATVDLHRGELADRRIELELDLGDVPDVLLDAHQLQRLLLNLWQNAVQALEDAPEGTRRVLRVATGISGEGVHLRVADSGIGMAPEVVARVFVPFFTTKRHGTGLGLAVAKKIVDDHHGTITVETAPGRGTVFHVELPGR